MTDRTEPVSRRLLLGAAVGGGAVMALTAASPARAEWCWWDCDTTNPNIIRTPESAFANVDFPYEVQYTNVNVPDIGEARIASYVAGPWWGEPVLLMHGNPTWAYIYREMIPIFAAAGYRVVMPDLFGFGRSDKVPKAKAHLYTYRNLEEAMFQWFEKQDLHRPNLFVQDYGGLVGLRILARKPHAFRRVVATNTALPAGAPNEPLSEEFQNWRFVSSIEEGSFLVPLVLGDLGRALVPGDAAQGATVTDLTLEEYAAYNAPYPSEDYLTGLRRLASLVPVAPWDPGARRNARFLDVLGTLSTPFLTLFGDQDPYTTPNDLPPGKLGWEEIFQNLIPGAQGQPHEILEGTGHFSQEDAPERLANKSIEWFRSTPT